MLPIFIELADMSVNQPSNLSDSGQFDTTPFIEVTVI